MNAKLQSIFSTILLLLALRISQCGSTSSDDIDPLSYSKLRGNSASTDDVRNLEGGEDNLHKRETEAFFPVLVATVIVNVITLMVMLSMIPILMNTKWNSFKSIFWVANALVHTPSETAKEYANIGRSAFHNKVNKHTYIEEETFLTDIFAPSFACGAILTSILFLIIPESIILIQRGTSSNEGEIEILPETISRFGAVVMVGYMLPLVLGALFPRSSKQENSYTDERVTPSELTAAVVQKRLRHQFTNLPDDQMTTNQVDQFTPNPREQITQNSNHQFTGNSDHHNIVHDNDNQDKSTRTIDHKRTRRQYKLPPLYERLSRYETLAFLYQKFIPGQRRQDISTSNQNLQENIFPEQMVGESNKVKKGNTFGSDSNKDSREIVNDDYGESPNDNDSDIIETEAELSYASNTSMISDTSKDSNELISNDPEKLLIDNNNELEDDTSFESSKNTISDTSEDPSFDEDINDTISDAGVRRGFNEETEVHNCNNINFLLATSILMGDITYYFFDGIFIGVSFMTCSTAAAVCVTLITVYKETSQYTANFFLLTIFAGISIPRAVLLIFLSGLAVVVGALMILNIDPSDTAMGLFLALASGVYFHVSASECLPRVYSVVKVSRDRWFSIIFFVIGSIPIGLTLLKHGQCG